MSKAVKTDRWGIDDRYLDVKGQAHVTSKETRAALMAAMGVKADGQGKATDDAGDSDGAEGPSGGTEIGGAVTPALYADVVVVRGSATWTAPNRGDLRLEDGTVRGVDAGHAVTLPLGYHDFTAHDGRAPIRIIACPERCHPPGPDGSAMWGWAVQLYATRSRASWGIGDLGDLRRVADWSRALGASVIMVNPLTAPTPVLPLEASPYFPSSRRYRNPLYLAVENVPHASDLGEQLVRLGASARGLNNQRLINRDAVFALKMNVLEMCFVKFGPGSEGAARFAAYQMREGTALTQFATYCALAEAHGKDWRQWPQGLRRPDGADVPAQVERLAARVTFHAWLQWLLDEQLALASEGMKIVQDLPIGLDRGGADAWCWQDMLAQNVSVGVPPDEYNPPGQDWGLVPFVPHRLRAAGYGPFIETLRATARHAGGLRIDHVMGLFRLFWIPQGLGPAHGAFVRPRADELLAIVALESERARAFAVGEDLGTVEPGVREKMADYGMLSYRLMYFEEGTPDQYPELALTTVTTHDLPTVAGLWTGSDVERARKAGAPQNEKAMATLREKVSALAGVSEDAAPTETIESLYAALGKAPSQVLLAALDDALAVEERPNIPGASPDWPNWSVALPVAIDDFEGQALPKKIAQALKRPGPSSVRKPRANHGQKSDPEASGAPGSSRD